MTLGEWYDTHWDCAKSHEVTGSGRKVPCC